jgi:ubiquinone/menaquinone biosynthesis C-methylase UbiE
MTEAPHLTRKRDLPAIAHTWKDVSRDYEKKVFSVTSFPARRKRIAREVTAGTVLDMGCGPLCLMLREIVAIPDTKALGSDFCREMISESRRRTKGLNVQYFLADNRCLPFRDSTIDTIVSVNSILPEIRSDIDLAFQEVKRVLRKRGRFVALFPSFEMSLIARDKWGMSVRVDQEQHREWDTTGWQCFYTLSDIESLVKRYRFYNHSVETISFSTPEEAQHIRQIYPESLGNVSVERILENPLYEHLLVATR